MGIVHIAFAVAVRSVHTLGARRFGLKFKAQRPRETFQCASNILITDTSEHVPARSVV
jgi:hypothetical protein